MARHAILDAIARSGWPDGLYWAASLPVSNLSGLFPEEYAAIIRAVPKRQAEFAGGRAAAREALSKLGKAGPVPVADDRAPVWPEGVVGSITHTDRLCLAVVGDAYVWAGLGIDLEEDAPLDPALIREVAHPHELAILDLPKPDAARRIFSAKEAAYKAQYPATRSLFGFDGMRADLEAGELIMAKNVGPGVNTILPMQQMTVDGMILSLCAWRA